jgi:hypothetical protein
LIIDDRGLTILRAGRCSFVKHTGCLEPGRETLNVTEEKRKIKREKAKGKIAEALPSEVDLAY